MGRPAEDGSLISPNHVAVSMMTQLSLVQRQKRERHLPHRPRTARQSSVPSIYQKKRMTSAQNSKGKLT